MDIRIGPGADLRYANLSGMELAFCDLSGADLSSAYLIQANLFRAVLTGADIRYCRGDGITIRNIDGMDYVIVYTKDTLAIESEQHSIEYWKNLSTDDEFWIEYRTEILTKIEVAFSNGNET